MPSEEFNIPDSIPEKIDLGDKVMIKRQHTIFHSDDFELQLIHPKDLSRFKQYTELSEAEIIQRFSIFSRMFFDNILTLDRREFDIKRNERTGEWEYLIRKMSS